MSYRRHLTCRRTARTTGHGMDRLDRRRSRDRAGDGGGGGGVRAELARQTATESLGAGDPGRVCRGSARAAQVSGWGEWRSEGTFTDD